MLLENKSQQESAAMQKSEYSYKRAYPCAFVQTTIKLFEMQIGVFCGIKTTARNRCLTEAGKGGICNTDRNENTR